MMSDISDVTHNNVKLTQTISVSFSSSIEVKTKTFFYAEVKITIGQHCLPRQVIMSVGDLYHDEEVQHCHASHIPLASANLETPIGRKLNPAESDGEATTYVISDFNLHWRVIVHILMETSAKISPIIGNLLGCSIIIVYRVCK